MTNLKIEWKKIKVSGRYINKSKILIVILSKFLNFNGILF